MVVTVEDVEKEEERGGGKRTGKKKRRMEEDGFYHSVYFTVCTSELFTNQAPFRPTQMKIVQSVREVTAYLNYLFVCFIIPAFCDLTRFDNTVWKCG
jgi:hypothetical protein